MAGDHLTSRGNFTSLTGDEIRTTFLNFFAEHGHKILPSASLVPDDPTVLLTIAGMLPFKPVFLGHQKRPAPRVTTSQKCIRTNDIENVGSTARHHTFFEMLGNFSFGDYFKEEAIKWAWQLSTEVFGLAPENLVISVFREDDETEKIWKEIIGVHPQRIIRMDEEDNFWSSGSTGPCGPCSELYYDFKPELGFDTIDLEDDSRFIEFYNLVFMQYNRDSAGTLTELDNCNIDTGMGLERMAQILQAVPNNYETDLIYPLIEKAASLAGVQYQDLTEKEKSSFKVIGDHSRAIVHLISDGVTASNLGRGYVLRRLLRRVIRHGCLIGITKPFLADLGELAIQLMQSCYPQLKDRREVVISELVREEERFLETLERGEKLLSELLENKPKEIAGEQAFLLYDTYGFPLELTEEIAQENGLKVDVKGFEKAMQKQRKRAQAASTTVDLTIQDTIDSLSRNIGSTNFQGYSSLEEKCNVQAIVLNGQSVQQAQAGDEIKVILETTPFYGEGGGQIGDVGTLLMDDESFVEINDVHRINNTFVHSGIVRKGILEVNTNVECRVDNISRQKAQANHTATHLLQSALKQVVDSSISQAGSLVSFDRLRFDFYSPRPISLDELHEIENLVNIWISQAYSLKVQQMKIEDAKAIGALAMFGEKYGDIVRVVNVPGVSIELCGGTHVSNTAELGVFKIVNESGIAAGVRRIEALAGPCVLDYLKDRDLIVKTLSERFKVQSHEIVDRVFALQEELKSVNKTLVKAQKEVASAKTSALIEQAMAIGSSQYIISRIDGINGDGMQSAAKDLVAQLGNNSAVILAGVPNPDKEERIIIIVALGSQIVGLGLHAGKFISQLANICGGGGGGRPDFAQAGGKDSRALKSMLEYAESELQLLLNQ